MGDVTELAWLKLPGDLVLGIDRKGRRGRPRRFILLGPMRKGPLRPTHAAGYLAPNGELIIDYGAASLETLETAQAMLRVS